MRFTTYDVTRDEPVELAGAEAAHVVDARYTMVSQGAKVLVREVNLLVQTEDGRAAGLLRALARGRLRRRRSCRPSSTPSGCDDARVLLGLVAAAGAFFVLAFVAAVITDSRHRHARADQQRVGARLCALAGAGSRASWATASPAPTPAAAARYAAAVAGPAAIALLFALTTTARDAAGPWLVLVAMIAAAAIGAHARERLATGQRRR